MSDLPWTSDGAGQPALVLVHAGLSGRKMWAPIVGLLADDHRVVTYDARGSGAAPAPTADWYDHRDLVAVLDAARVKTAVLVGASDGGRIALDTAVENPERVAGLVLLAPALPRSPSPSTQVRYDHAEDVAIARGDINAARRINVDHWIVGVDRSVEDLDPAVVYDTNRWIEAQLRRDAEPSVGEAQEVAPPLIERLPQIDVPTVVLVGEHDQPRSVLIAGLLAGALPNARMQWVAGSAHLPSVERPEVVAEVIRSLATQIPGR